jgi:hypothetical protein
VIDPELLTDGRMVDERNELTIVCPTISTIQYNTIQYRQQCSGPVRQNTPWLCEVRGARSTHTPHPTNFTLTKHHTHIHTYRNDPPKQQQDCRRKYRGKSKAVLEAAMARVGQSLEVIDRRRSAALDLIIARKVAAALPRIEAALARAAVLGAVVEEEEMMVMVKARGVKRVREEVGE